ncbi:MAG: lysine--tRNA ligase [Candidatus Magasanikbacteria bacterium CG_4_10_14_0_8_um_filter_32_14]|uniref:Lysine--tRNA ligase n=2 Tax=Candidatus Magasanikiibacteriota TaxID=1752731 RepID=A0A2M7R9L8_9BACT|nr:MAG: lysine--tRNA ligase [Candidatus Magasanikbacteria bacterium CG1_02_32_51]PIY93192.1 MAG: lysine--tRNA ligase [Candidatus Magasanikbacteria bacterium CG_4_10_14_0_8_um_filter_32_14]
MFQTTEFNINDERKIRLKKLKELEEIEIDPFPAKNNRKQTIKQALDSEVETFLSVAGRIMTKREMGKLTFCHLQDESGRMQIAFKQDDLGIENYKLFIKKIDSGDIIEIEGKKFITHKGEPSILVSKWTILSKALLPLPDKFHGLNDEEMRYRKRYLDFLVNPEEKEKIIVRGKILRYLREFLQSENFIEVETPVLETIASGAMAKTFDTHLNAYDLDVHLRICIGELWQKRLLVGGFEKTFEIGRAFRNEGVDHQHNPEFTMLEYYWAFADYEDNMKLHEKMIPFVIEKSIGKLEVEIDGQKINFETPYPRITFHEAVLKYSGIDINKYTDIEELKMIMKEKSYDHENLTERGKLLDNLYKQSARPKIIQPTFVLNYPIELKPLAKKSVDPRYTEMFQLIVNGFELSNSYTELNDPLDQIKRFEDQTKNKASGDDEAMANDWDFVEALEYGMPPATGTGIGIDRFVALITGSHTLREVTAFPLMKPLVVEEIKNKKEKKK